MLLAARRSVRNVFRMLTTTVEAYIGLTVDPSAEIKFLVNPEHPEDITLAIGDLNAEITFRRETLESVRDKADEAIQRSAQASCALPSS